MPDSWRIEGKAMRDALVEDFGKIADVELILADGDGEDEFREKAAKAHWTLVIAPETEGLLQERAQWVIEASGRLLSPAPDLILPCADKAVLSERLAGIISMPKIDPNTYPQIWKPRDGAGSLDLFYVPDEAIAQMLEENGYGHLLRTEYVAGIHASIAFLCGPQGIQPLLPCWQLLSDDGRFAYLGGEVPILPHLEERVLKVARPAVEWLHKQSPIIGYIGIDVVLGDGRDVLIEINPRITTSYIGLRQIAETNLAEAMLKIAMGQEWEVRWKEGKVRFEPNGLHYQLTTRND